jgi:hypothetical protein
MDSGRAPSLIGQDQVALLINAQTRTGYIENRPGWIKHELSGDDAQCGRFQMASGYISADGSPFIVASIGGNIVRFDLTTYVVTNLSLGPGDLMNPSNLPRAWFCQAETFLCIQDNSSIPLIFDGATLRRGRPIAFGGDEFPIGNAMAYNNGRLWVALPDRRSFVGGDLAYSVTGDASDVLKSTQNQFLTSGSFALPSYAGFITAMQTVAVQDSVLGQGPLVVFGQYAAGTVNAPFAVEEWQNTNSPIASVGLLSAGPAGADAVTPVNGDLWYRASDGIRTFMIARRDHGTWVNTPVSQEMERILKRDDPYLLQFTSSAVFNNRLLTTCSPFRANVDAVQYGFGFRGLTVLDFKAVSSMFDRSAPVWNGIWNGLSILQILVVNCFGKDRCFLFALNSCSQIELWELTTDDRFDNLTSPITWNIETRTMGFSDGSESLKELQRTEISGRNIVGSVPFSIQYRPDEYPFWIDLDNGEWCAKTGMCETPGCATPQGPFPQYRPRNLSASPSFDDCEECVDKKFRHGYEFQFRLNFTGAAGLRRFRAVATSIPEAVANGCLADKIEEECCTEAGCNPAMSPWTYLTPSVCGCLLEITEQPHIVEPEILENPPLLSTDGNWYIVSAFDEGGGAGTVEVDQTAVPPGDHPYLVIRNSDDGMFYKFSLTGTTPDVFWEITGPVFEDELNANLTDGVTTWSLGIVAGPTVELTEI